MSYFEVRLFASTLGLPGDPSDYILVNARGERFMREDRRRSTLAEAVVRQPDGMAWMVINAPAPNPSGPRRLQGDGHRDDLGLQRLHSYEGKGFPRTRSPHDEPIGPGARSGPFCRESSGPTAVSRSTRRRGDRPQGQTHEGTCGRGRHYGRHSRRTRLMGDMLASAAVFGRIAARTLVKNGRAVKRQD